jgi:HD superfamily phosphohydrolase YqeK
MSVVVSSDLEGVDVARQAASGVLPEWACAGEARRAHAGRVAALMTEWARSLGLDEADVTRWAAAGWLHDALRDADPAELRRIVPLEFADAPGKLLHGPAAAERLRGQVDEEMEVAIRYHTVGHPAFGTLGCALYLADFLEPGRRFSSDWPASLRARLPKAHAAALVEVVAARIAHLLERRKPIRPETAAFWNVALERAA